MLQHHWHRLWVSALTLHVARTRGNHRHLVPFPHELAGAKTRPRLLNVPLNLDLSRNLRPWRRPRCRTKKKQLYFKLTFPRSKFSCVWITGSGSRGSARRVQADTRTRKKAPAGLHMLQLQMTTDNSTEKLGFSSYLCLLAFNFGPQNLKLNGGGKSIYWKRNVTFSYSYLYYLVSLSSRSRTPPPIGHARNNI